MADNNLGATVEHINTLTIGDGALTAQKDAGVNLSQAALGMMERGSLQSQPVDVTKTAQSEHLDFSQDIYSKAQDNTHAPNIAQPGGEIIPKFHYSAAHDKRDQPNIPAPVPSEAAQFGQQSSYSPNAAGGGSDATGGIQKSQDLANMRKGDNK